jgi:DNA-binding MarR family transcriptional regulator
METDVDEAVRSLRMLIVAGESYRQVVAARTRLGVTETQAVSQLAIHGDRGQTDLANDLGITTSAATSLVDRLEQHGIAERYNHPRDRRRMLVRLTAKGQELLELSHRWLAASMLDIDPERLADLSEMFRRVAQGLHAESVRLSQESS